MTLCYVPSENLKILSLGRNNIKALSGLVSLDSNNDLVIHTEYLIKQCLCVRVRVCFFVCWRVCVCVHVHTGGSGRHIIRVVDLL